MAESTTPPGTAPRSTTPPGTPPRVPPISGNAAQQQTKAQGKTIHRTRSWHEGVRQPALARIEEEKETDQPRKNTDSNPDADIGLKVDLSDPVLRLFYDNYTTTKVTTRMTQRNERRAKEMLLYELDRRAFESKLRSAAPAPESASGEASSSSGTAADRPAKTRPRNSDGTTERPPATRVRHDSAPAAAAAAVATTAVAGRNKGKSRIPVRRRD